MKTKEEKDLKPGEHRSVTFEVSATKLIFTTLEDDFEFRNGFLKADFIIDADWPRSIFIRTDAFPQDVDFSETCLVDDVKAGAEESSVVSLFKYVAYSFVGVGVDEFTLVIDHGCYRASDNLPEILVYTSAGSDCTGEHG